jgi:hypothetical protein
VVGELRDKHICKQARAAQTSLNRSARRRGLRDLYLSGQMLGQRPARRLFRCRARCPRDLDKRRAFVGYKIFKAQFQLFDLVIELAYFGERDHGFRRIVITNSE